MPIFYCPWKQKSIVFLMLSGVVEREYWSEMSWCYECLKAGNNETPKLNKMSIIWTLKLHYILETLTTLFKGGGGGGGGLGFQK